MSEAVFETTLERIRQHVRDSGQAEIRVTFHGGEPCLAGALRLGSWCARIREALTGVRVHLGIQTNGTLIDHDWAGVFRDHHVDVGISMDGPKEIHDLNRVDHRGNGSYDDVARGLECLQARGVSYGIMSVIPFGIEPIAVHRHFVSLGCNTLTYILPNFSHDGVGEIHRQFGPTPCADFLIPVFDEWWFNGTIDLCVRDLWNMARIILGGRSEIETFGNTAPGYAFVETDGSIEGLDNLYVCKDGIAQTGLNVLTADFGAISRLSTLHRTAIFEGMPLPTGCRDCSESETCAGGYLPHRYSSRNGFDNPSVWCADFKRLFAHLRRRLGVSAEETRFRRNELNAQSSLVAVTAN